MKSFRIRNINRIVVIGFGLIVQTLLYFSMLSAFNEYSNWFYGLSIAISILVMLWVINNDSNPAYKMAWIILIMLAPLFGGIFYLGFGNNRMSRKDKKKLIDMETSIRRALPAKSEILERVRVSNKRAALQARYLQEYAGYPPADNSKIQYYSIGETAFQALKEALLKAEHFIFLEYFIIEPGAMWDEILEILQDKVKQGLDVRVVYDDFGCLVTLPVNYRMKLESMGIKCQVFNRLTLRLSFRLNNRDHRKIAVIDNQVAFTGGFNLADEYINAYEKHGHWKDVGVRISGDAVWHFTVMFLSMWDYLAGTESDYEEFRLAGSMEVNSVEGIILPFSDSPLDEEPVGQNVYLNLISKARNYVYITTPYLVIDDGMMTALTNAAKSGVDVRIMTPHIPDKWYVHAVTRSHYARLIRNGVKIYEYTPGFIHSKTFVMDDLFSVVGTINMDYRSLYLHFECGVWTWKTGVEEKLRRDFLKTQEKCLIMNEEELQRLGFFRSLGFMILRVFAPLM